jgi:hypothetical protein
MVLLAAGFTLTAQAALVKNPKQPIILVGGFGSDTSGILPFSSLVQIKSDGTTVPFVLPPNQDLIITYFHYNHKAVEMSLTTNVDMRMGPFFSRSLMMSNGGSAFIETFDPGFRISLMGLSDPRYNFFYTVNLKTGSIIPGTIGVRLVGYLAPRS